MTYWLATSGTTGLSVGTPPGVTSGEIADVAAMSSTVTRSNGAAQLQTGKTIAKADVAKDFADEVRVAISWTNAIDAEKVLNNKHAQITMGIYHPVSTTATSCTTGKLKITDGGTDFCGILDTAATGVGDGQLFFAQDVVAGFLVPTVDASGSLSACGADSGGATTWCQPSGLDADKRRVYIIASILTPGGIPHGQQAQVGNLEFFVRIRRNTADA